MKLQHLAVIFVIIIIPISFVMSQYIQTQIDTINLQTMYTSKLNNATHDALKAFQINSVNNKYSSLSDSKIRDIEASINTFYNSLGTSMNTYTSSRGDLSAFIPAILFNLYDGYYIYSSYNNLYTTTGTEEEERVQIQDNNNYQDGLRPYIYYSCKYKLASGKTVVVNYTLDNAITVYGDFGSGYETRSGYLINPKNVKNINTSSKTLVYDGVTIKPETLIEHLLTIENAETGQILERDYPYIVYNNKKVYQDINESGNAIYETTQVPIYDASGNVQYDGYGNIKYKTITAPKYFWYENNKKTYLQSEKVSLLKYIEDNGVGFKSISAYEYYYNAYIFSNWIVNDSGLGNVTQANVIRFDGGNNTIGTDLEYLSTNTGSKKIFNTTLSDNDPMLSDSIFNQHRMAVIRKSIETNLTTAIANYNSQGGGTTYEFVMPIIDEVNWYKIVNNVSVISFMQGIPIGQKYYNNYSVITNTKNEEVINEQSVYLVAEDSSGNLEYHQPGCKELIEKQKNNPDMKVTAYTDLSFSRQTVKITESNIHYFYPQVRVGKTTTGCYNCIVNASGDYDIDSIIKGQIKDYKTEKVLYDESELVAIRTAYLTGLARERRDLYKSNFD